MVAGEFVTGWRVSYSCERVVEELASEEFQILQREASHGRPALTVFVTDHPVISGLSPAVVTAPHLGIVWDSSRFRGPHDNESLLDAPVPLAVTGFGTDASAWLNWPASLTPYLIRPALESN